MASVIQTMGFQVLGLVDLLVDPQSAMKRLAGGWTWLWSFFIIGSGAIVLGFAMLPIMLHLVEQNLPLGMSQEQIQESLRMALTYQRIGIMISPVALLLKWALTAGVLFLACVLSDIRTTFRVLFGLVAHCSLITFLQDLTVYAIIKLKGTEVQRLTDLSPGLGLDLLLRGYSKPVMAALSYFSVFTVWYIVIIGVSLSVLTGCSKRRAFVAISPVWLFPFGLTVGLAWLTS